MLGELELPSQTFGTPGKKLEMTNVGDMKIRSIVNNASIENAAVFELLHVKHFWATDGVQEFHDLHHRVKILSSYVLKTCYVLIFRRDFRHLVTSIPRLGSQMIKTTSQPVVSALTGWIGSGKGIRHLITEERKTRKEQITIRSIIVFSKQKMEVW